MAVYVMSDLHGEREAFHAMLEKIGLTMEDTLYVIGDAIDRGPDGIAILQELMHMSNVQMLLGNHEWMMLNALVPQRYTPQARIWDYNGNRETLAQYHALDPWQQERLLRFLEDLPDCLDVTVGGRSFFLVHGYPGANTHDAVWGRPVDLRVEPPLPGRQLIIGHTPVPFLVTATEAQMRHYIEQLERSGDHVHILHADGFIDIDCGCGHHFPGAALGCLRLDDLEEFYVPMKL